MLSRALKTLIPVESTTPPTEMHQVATPAPTRSPRKRRSRRRRYIIFGVVGLILLWIIVGSIMGKREKPIPVTTEKAVRKTIVQTVSATGKIQPEVEVKISPEVAGESAA